MSGTELCSLGLFIKAHLFSMEDMTSQFSGHGVTAGKPGGRFTKCIYDVAEANFFCNIVFLAFLNANLNFTC